MTDHAAPMTTGRRRAWAIGLTVLVLLIYFLIWKSESPIGEDGHRDYGAIRLADERNYYVHCADRVAEEGLGYLTTEDSLRSPPLPWLWLLLFGRSILLARAANVVCIIGASWLIAAIVRDRWGDRLALMAFALCALGYQVVLFGATVLTEPLAFWLVCACLWAIHRADRSHRWAWVALSGVLTALASYARPSLQLWPIAIVCVVGVWTLIQRWRPAQEQGTQSNWTFRRVLLLLAVHCVVLAPWLVKNAVCFGVPRIANGFGAVFYLGSEFKIDGDEPVFAGMNWPNHKVQGPGGHMSLDGERRLVEAAKKNIREHPAAWLELAVRKLGRTLIGGPKWHFFPAATLRGKMRIEGKGETLVEFAWWTVLGTIVTVCGIAGLALRMREGGGLFVGAASLVLYMVALHSATYALPRFAVPLWPAFVLGCMAMAAIRPGRIVLVMLTLTWMGIVVYLVGLYRVKLPYEVSAERSQYFSIDADASAEGPDATHLRVELDGNRPAFNTCIIVTARVERLDARRVGATLRLEPAGEMASDVALVIPFQLVSDGRTHSYLLCTELIEAWRKQNWGAVHVETNVEDSDVVEFIRVQIGH